ncbi:MAG: Hsp20/alpha crystallin family protein [Phycisphaerae bacterium]|nr:Hsp20/alpha crystallin family protein [Phycisphaerae bacterium]
MMPSVQAEGKDKSFIGHRINHWVDHVLGEGFHRYRPVEAWTPSINFYEDESGYCIVVDLAGIKPEEVDLRVENGILVLAGDRPSPPLPDVCDPVSLHLMEIDHGRFSRSLELPDDVDVDAITASYKVGYLCVKLPRRL